VGIVVMAAVGQDVFLTERNLSNLARQLVTNGLLSLGMLVVILTGGIDLSVGSVVALSGIVAAGLSEEVSVPVAFAIAIAVAASCGAANGFVIARFRVAPFVVTLAALTTIRGLVYVYSETPITPLDLDFLWLGSASVGPVPLAFLVVVAGMITVALVLRRTVFGRSLYAVGGNEEAARLAGIPVQRVVFSAYIVSGAFAGLAGIVLASRVGIAQPSVGVGTELDAIAACVIGGAALSGGRGTVVGLAGGLLLLSVIDNLLNLYDVQTYYQQVLKGAIIVAVILLRRRDA
jgi:ribose/xylose/arabinose/galactoside ABC-type transport system permease subunit